VQWGLLITSQVLRVRWKKNDKETFLRGTLTITNKVTSNRFVKEKAKFVRTFQSLGNDNGDTGQIVAQDESENKQEEGHMWWFGELHGKKKKLNFWPKLNKVEGG